MPTMILARPIDAILDFHDFAQRTTEALNARPGARMESWCEQSRVGNRIVSTWKAEITTQTDEHLTTIHDAMTAMGVAVLAAS
jgi:hypothetical protein